MAGGQMMAWREPRLLLLQCQFITNGNHQGHRQGQRERNEGVPLGKSVLPCTIVHSNVNANIGLRGRGWLVLKYFGSPETRAGGPSCTAQRRIGDSPAATGSSSGRGIGISAGIL